MRRTGLALASCLIMAGCQSEYGEPVNLSEVSGEWVAGYPTVELNEDGRALVLWSEFSAINFDAEFHSSHFRAATRRWSGAKQLPHENPLNQFWPYLDLTPDGQFVSWWSDAEPTSIAGFCPAGDLASARFDLEDREWTPPQRPANPLEAGVHMRQTRANAAGQAGVLYSSKRADTPGLIFLRRESLGDDWDDGIYVDIAPQPEPGTECSAGYRYASASLADDGTASVLALISTHEEGLLRNRLFATTLAPDEGSWSVPVVLEIPTWHGLRFAESTGKRSFVVWSEDPDPSDGSSSDTRVHLVVFEHEQMQWRDMGIINDPALGAVQDLVIESNPRGDVLIAWSQGEAYFQRLDRSGKLIGPPARVQPPENAGSVESSHISLAINELGDGAIGVAYTIEGQDQLAALRLPRSGDEPEGPIIVDRGRRAPTEYGEYPYMWSSDVAINNSGDAVIAWSRINDWGAKNSLDEIEIYSRDVWVAHF